MTLKKQENIHTEETELVKKCQQGDHVAFKSLYDMFLNKVYSLCFGMVGDEQTANIVTQEIFVKIYYKISTFTFKSSIGTWIYKLSFNYCIDYMKKIKRRKTIPISTAQELSGFIDNSSSDEFHIRIQTSEAVQKAIMKLKPKLRTVTILRYMNDLSYAEIAEVLGCSIGTISSRINTSNVILQRELAYLIE